MSKYETDAEALAKAKRGMRNLAPDAVDTIAHLARFSDDEKIRLAAAKTVVEYSLGKPTQQIDMDVTHQVDEMSDEEIMRKLRKKFDDQVEEVRAEH